MAMNHVTFTEGLYFEDLLEEQAIKRQEFIFKTRLDFTAAVRRYFTRRHPISLLQLTQRRIEVCVSFNKLRKSFGL